MLESVVGIFSRFTSEALLFQSLGIFILSAIYAAYWITRKRRYGAIGKETVSPEVVKEYLGQLIGDAQDLQSQLFGLVQASTTGQPGSVAMGAVAGSIGTVSGGGDPALVAKLKELETKMQAQTAAMNAVVSKKTRIESELLQAKKGAPQAVATGDNADLLEKIKQLEAKLAEYSIIEDDLANLKRLQQENAQLKVQVAGGPSVAGSAAATVVAGTAAAAGTEAIKVEGQKASNAADAKTVISGEAPEAPATQTVPGGNVTAAQEAAQPAPVAAPPAEAKTDDQFEGLVDQVEKSLGSVGAEVAQASADATAAAGAEAPPTDAAPPSPDTVPTGQSVQMDKSDADLVEEFERMLNG